MYLEKFSVAVEVQYLDNITKKIIFAPVVVGVRILNSEFRIGRTGKELFSYSKGSITTLRLSLLIIVIATTHLKAECISRKTR